VALNARECRFAFRTLPFLHSLDGTAGLVELRSRPHRRVLAWRPDLIGDLFRIDRVARHAGSDTLGPLVGRGSMLFLDGDRHTQTRRILGPPLRGGRLKGYRQLIAATAERAVRELPAGKPFPLSGWTHRLTLRLVSQIVLGSAPEPTLAQFSAWMDSALGSRPRTLAYRYLRPPAAVPSPWRTFLRRREALAADLLRHAAATAPGTSNLRDLLVGMYGPGDDELADQLITLLFAGHETTGSAIAWTLYWLDRHPAVRHEVEAELAATGSDGADAIEVPLLAAACLEALRISPPATVAGHRVLTADAELGGTGYPAGTVLTPCIYLAHRQPDVFAHPGRFEPRRFLEQHPSAQHYLPFGGGVRRCLGADLALLELRMVVATVLRLRPLRCVDAVAAVPQLRGPAMAPSRALHFVAPA
jgi:cytochrome P450